MSTDHIVDQQAFRHGDGKGGFLHSVAFICRLDPNYNVAVFSCSFGADGLPDYSAGKYTNPGKSFTNVRQASRFFDELVKQQRGRWTFLDPEETLPFTVDSPRAAKAPVFAYVAESNDPVRSSKPVEAPDLAYVAAPTGNDGWTRLRQHLAPCYFEHGVQSFLNRLGNRLMRDNRRWVMPLTADFLPIVLSLAIAGVGEMQRDGVVLTEGQLRTMARSVVADPDIDALYRALGLRELLPDYAAAIGGGGAALVL